MEVLYEVRGRNLLIYLPEELDHHNAKIITEQSDWYIISNKIQMRCHSPSKKVDFWLLGMRKENTVYYYITYTKRVLNKQTFKVVLLLYIFFVDSDVYLWE